MESLALNSTRAQTTSTCFPKSTKNTLSRVRWNVPLILPNSSRCLRPVRSKSQRQTRPSTKHLSASSQKTSRFTKWAASLNTKSIKAYRMSEMKDIIPPTVWVARWTTIIHRTKKFMQSSNTTKCSKAMNKRPKKIRSFTSSTSSVITAKGDSWILRNYSTVRLSLVVSRSILAPSFALRESFRKITNTSTTIWSTDTSASEIAWAPYSR